MPGDAACAEGFLRIQYQTRPVRRERVRSSALRVAGLAALIVLCAVSAVVTKASMRSRTLEPLTSVTVSDFGAQASTPAAVVQPSISEPPVRVDPAPAIQESVATVPSMTRESPEANADPYSNDPTIRWFNGRPIRPARTMNMVVTAYSPDSRSCGPDACGITSSVHNVYTNGMKLVAADTRLLPLGSLVSVPGYDDDRVVPVLDRGGAIKGHRLDVLYPTHEVAREWGVKKLEVTVWEYADGLPADDFRKIRDSKN